MATKKYEPELKAKIALEAIKNQKNTAEICIVVSKMNDKFSLRDYPLKAASLYVSALSFILENTIVNIKYHQQIYMIGVSVQRYGKDKKELT